MLTAGNAGVIRTWRGVAAVRNANYVFPAAAVSVLPSIDERPPRPHLAAPPPQRTLCYVWVTLWAGLQLQAQRQQPTWKCAASPIVEGSGGARVTANEDAAGTKIVGPERWCWI